MKFTLKFVQDLTKFLCFGFVRMVTAYNLKTREKVQMHDIEPLKFKIGNQDTWRYRLSGVSKDGDKLSKMVSEAEAKKYGTPKVVATKSKAKPTGARIGKKALLKDERTCKEIGAAAERRCKNLRTRAAPKKSPKKKATPKKKAAAKKKAPAKKRVAKKK
jgi:hypothetical protein